jgi:hypothetical protein
MPTAEGLAEERKAEWAKLGDHGEERAAHAWKKLSALVGEDKAKALEGVIGDAAAVEAVEILLEKAGEPKFSPGKAVSDAPDPSAMLAEAQKLQGDSDYYQNAEKQKTVSEIFKKLYPGQVPTAATGPSWQR